MKTVSALFILALVSCSSHMGSYMRSSTKEVFDLQGHRGCRGLMPENTIPAMLHAVKLGVTTLEMDAVITSDKKVILSHEPFFNHEITTRPDGSFVTKAEEKGLNIYEMTFAQTMTYDVGLKPHPKFPEQKKMKAIKPALSAVIDSVEAYCTLNNVNPPFYNIETKSNKGTDGIFHPEPAEYVELLMNVVKYKLIDKRVIIQSFDPRTLQYLHEKYPTVKTSLLIEGDDKRGLDVHLSELGFLPTVYSPAYLLVTPELIKQCKEKNIQVKPWTVNDSAEMKRLKEMGVDGLITDYPNLKF